MKKMKLKCESGEMTNKWIGRLKKKKEGGAWARGKLEGCREEKNGEKDMERCLCCCWIIHSLSLHNQLQTHTHTHLTHSVYSFSSSACALLSDLSACWELCSGCVSCRFVSVPLSVAISVLTSWCFFTKTSLIPARFQCTSWKETCLHYYKLYSCHHQD